MHSAEAAAWSEADVLLSVIIPSYNEARTIREVIERVEGLDLSDMGLEKEVIVVDGGSSDGTLEILRDIASEGRIALVREEPRRGKGYAIRLGLDRAVGSLVIVQDADLELDPAEYPRLLRPIVEGKAEVVYGSRFLQGPRRGAVINRIGNWVLTWLVNRLYGARLTDVETCYKVFRREVLSGFRLRCERFDFDPEVTIRVLKAGIPITEVPVTYRPRSAREGKKIRWRDGLDTVKLIWARRFGSD